MLDDPTYTSDIIEAFSKDTWAESSSLFAVAITKYIMSGTVTVDVTGVAVPPSGSPYPVTATGLGAIVLTTTPALAAQIIVAATSPLWQDYASQLASAINTHLLTGTIATVDSNIATGAGAGLISVPESLYSAFAYDVTEAMLVGGTTWALVATLLCTATKKLLAGAVITTIDAGPAPHPWTGSGSGSIT